MAHPRVMSLCDVVHSSDVYRVYVHTVHVHMPGKPGSYATADVSVSGKTAGVTKCKQTMCGWKLSGPRANQPRHAKLPTQPWASMQQRQSSNARGATKAIQTEHSPEPIPAAIPLLLSMKGPTPGPTQSKQILSLGQTEESACKLLS